MFLSRVFPPLVLTGCLVLSGCALNHSGNSSNKPVTPKRYAWIIGLKPEKVTEYKNLHAAVWPDVLATIKQCHIQNYSIYLRQMPDGSHYLFSYLEYTGADFAADMAKMAADLMTQEWWKHCDPCQIPLANRQPGEKWSDMEEVFHLD